MLSEHAQHSVLPATQTRNHTHAAFRALPASDAPCLRNTPRTPRTRSPRVFTQEPASLPRALTLQHIGPPRSRVTSATVMPLRTAPAPRIRHLLLVPFRTRAPNQLSRTTTRLSSPRPKCTNTAARSLHLPFFTLTQPGHPNTEHVPNSQAAKIHSLLNTPWGPEDTRAGQAIGIPETPNPTPGHKISHDPCSNSLRAQNNTSNPGQDL